MVTRSLKKALVNILARTLVRQQFEAFSTVTFEAANGVPAVVVTATIMEFTLINVFAGFAIRLKSKSYWAAAAYTCGCVLTRAVTASVIQRTCLHKQSTLNSFVYLSQGRGIVIRGGGGHFILFYTGSAICVQGVPDVTPADGPLLGVLTDVLAAPVAMVTGQNAAPLVLGQLETRPALTGNATFGCFLTDVSTAMFFVHAAQAFHGAMDACVLIVTQEKTFLAAALIASHGVDTYMLTATIVEDTFIHIETVVSIMCQMKPIKASTAVIAGYVVTFVYTAAIVFQITFINVFTMFPVPFKSCFTSALV